MKIKIKLLFFLFFLSVHVYAQDTQQLMNSLLKDDSAAITALALYPQDVRKNILEACAYPETLVRIEALQKNTSESFKKLLAGLSKEEQQKVWDLSPYPALVAQLIQGGKKSKEELEKIVLDYPEEIRETAVDYGRSHYDLLVKVNSLRLDSEKAFEGMIKDYPEQVKISLRELVERPEVISILTADMKMSVLAGDLYKKQPALIQQKLDSISTEHARQNAKDLEDWKAGLEKNPEARKEMEEASKEFAREQGYKEEELSLRSETIIVNYVVRPYPYWYGYPSWYDYPYWYPYPYWYDWGFYWGPKGVVYIGFPSPFFVHWYFNSPHHHYHYNHFSDYCVGYYYGHHRPATGFHREVSDWVKTNEPHLPKNFFANDAERPDRIKEFGEFENNYNNEIKNKPGKNITRDEFLESNASAYPHIRPVLTEPRPKTGKPAYEKPRPLPVYEEKPRSRPIIKIPQDQPRPVQPQIQPKPRPVAPKVPPVPRQKQNATKKIQAADSNVPKDNFSRMNEAEEYHRSKWKGE